MDNLLAKSRAIRQYYPIVITQRIKDGLYAAPHRQTHGDMLNTPALTTQLVEQLSILLPGILLSFHSSNSWGDFLILLAD
jgi:hypothetical protein